MLKTSTYSVGQRPDGRDLNLTVFELEGSRPGPTAYFQASVHGAELQGNLVIRDLATKFQTLDFAGKVIFVPMANPEGITQKAGQYTAGRFNPVTGHNWNRNYFELFSQSNVQKHGHSISEFCRDFLSSYHSQDKDFREKISLSFKDFQLKALKSLYNQWSQRGPRHNGLLNLTLQRLASEADFVFDLHTGPVATRYIYAPSFGLDDAFYFGFPHLLEIPHEFAGAQDEATFMNWVTLQKTLKDEWSIDFDLPFRSYTIELGSEERISNRDAKKDSYGLLRYLAHKGMVSEKDFSQLEGQTWVETEKKEIAHCHLENYQTYYAPYGGLTEFLVSPGESFKKGETLAYQYQFHDFLEKDPHCVKALADGVAINHFTSASTPQGSELYQVMENIVYKPLPSLH